MSPRVRLLVLIALVIGGIQLLWLLVPAVQEGITEFPVGFLIAFCLPFLIGATLLPRFRRTGSIIIGLFSLLLAVLSVNVIIAGPGNDWKWTDYLSVYVAGPVAVVALVLSLMVLFARKPAVATA